MALGAPRRIVLVPSNVAFVAGGISPLITVELRDICGNLAPVSSATRFSLSSSSVTGTFRSGGTGTGNATVTSITVPAGTSSFTIFYSDTKADIHTITARPASGQAQSAGTATIEVVPAEISQLVVTSAAGAFEPDEVSAPIVIQSQDRFGNPSSAPEQVQLDLATTSDQGRFDTAPDGPFNGSVNSVRLELGSRAVRFFYVDGKLGTPTITITENPDRGWAAATQARKIALKFAVNNQGRVLKTTVHSDRLTTDGRLIVPSDDGTVVILVEPRTKANAPDKTRVELVTVKRIESPGQAVGQKFVGPIVDLEPNGTTFTVPIEISVRYNREDLAPGTDEKMLKIVLWNGTIWEPLEGSVVDTKEQRITAKLTHFSVYSVLDQEYDLGGGDLPWIPTTAATLGIFAAGLWFAFTKWRSIAFVSTPYTLVPNQASGEIRVRVRGFAGRYLNVKRAPMKIVIKANSATGQLSSSPDGSFASEPLNLEIPVSQREAVFFYKDTVPGDVKLSVRPKGKLWKMGHQKATVVKE